MVRRGMRARAIPSVMGLAILIAIVAEITSVVIAADLLGGLWTLAALALAGGIGMAVLTGRGVTTLTNAGQAVQRGEAMGPVVADGALLALAGVLLMIPGFVSDVAALVLLVPWTRRAVAGYLVERFKAKVVTLGGAGGMNLGRDGDVIETTGVEIEPEPPPQPKPLP